LCLPYGVKSSALDYAYGYPDAMLSLSLIAGEAYYVPLYVNSPYRDFQFRVDPVSQAILGGTVNFSGILSSFAETGVTITGADIAIYADNSLHTPIGMAVINTGDGSWSAMVDVAGSSVPALFVITANLSNGNDVNFQEQRSISGSNSGLNFSPAALTGASPVSRTTVNQYDRLLFVPTTSGGYSFRASAGAGGYRHLMLYDGAMGSGIAGEGDLEIVRTLNAGDPYLIEVYANYNQFDAYQFRVEELQPVILSGIVSFSGLAPLTSADINFTEIRVYTGGSTPDQLGTITADSEGSWSVTVPASESQAVKIEACIYLNNGLIVAAQRQDTVSGDTTGLDLAPVSLADGQAVVRTSCAWGGDGFLFVPTASGLFNLEAISGNSTPWLYLYDTMGTELARSNSGSLYAELSGGTPYIVQVDSIWSFTAYQFRATATASASIGGSVDYSSLPGSISSIISSATVSGYLNNSTNTEIVSGVLVEGSNWSTLIPANLTGQAARLVLTLNLSNGHSLTSHIETVLPATDIDFSLASIASDSAINGKSDADGYGWLLFVPENSGTFALQAESDTAPYLSVYDGVTGSYIYGVSGGYLVTLNLMLSAGTPYIIRISIGGQSFHDYQFTAFAPVTLGGSVNYSSLPSSISSAISSATVSGYLNNPANTQIFSDAAVGSGAWSALIPGNAIGQTARLVLTMNLNNGRSFYSYIQTVLSTTGLDFSPAAIPSDTIINGKSNASREDRLLFVPASNGNYTLQAESDTYTAITVYDGVTGAQIITSYSWSLLSMLDVALNAGTSYIIEISTYVYSFRDYQFSVIPPVTLGGAVNFSSLSSWSTDSAEILIFSGSNSSPYSYDIRETGMVNLPGGSWSISGPIGGEAFIALVALSSGGEGVLDSQTVSVSGDNNAINFAPGDTDKNVATGAWHSRTTSGSRGNWLLWIPGAAGEYVLDAETVSGMDPYMYLHDGITGDLIAYNDDRVDNHNSQIQRNDFVAGHPYLIRVRDYGNNSGTFQFKAEEVSP
jgi:hypothetical protein